MDFGMSRSNVENGGCEGTRIRVRVAHGEITR